MALKPNHPTQRRCPCGGANPDCLQCGGKGVIETPGVRPIMAGPAGIRRRLPISRESVGTIPGPPEPVRCPHCGWEVLILAVHLTEAHPEQPQHETAAEREAREQEEARQAVVAAELARREAEAAQRKAEARARRQAVEGPQSAVAGPGRAQGPPQLQPRGPQGAPGRPADAAAPADPPAPAGIPDGGAPVRDRWPAAGSDKERGAGAESRRASPADEARERPRRAGDPRSPSAERGVTGAGARPAEGPMALAFRLAREKKKRAE
jgi:hypothetical protein